MLFRAQVSARSGGIYGCWAQVVAIKGGHWAYWQKVKATAVKRSYEERDECNVCLTGMSNCKHVKKEVARRVELQKEDVYYRFTMFNSDR